ncbi:MAG: HD-GYP domain-containing protein [Acidiferrobacteraceae bacterium]|jgi:putative nucleotidyltransferase with HDIG domain
MRKKVNTSDLAIGMYVAELDRPWTSTQFLFQGFEIGDEATLEDLRSTCEFVFIDTEGEAGAIAHKKRQAEKSSPVVTVLEEKSDQVRDLDPEVLGGKTDSKRWKDTASLEEEMGQAREIETRAREVLYTTLDDVRMGRSINTSGAKAVIADMVESIIRNPDAMGVLAQLKNADEYTALHSMRVCILALTFGRHLELTRQELNLLGIGALLHDVGKMKVPTEILNKHGQLTEKEYEIMKTHVPHGVQILENSEGISELSIQVAARHHERYGGGGYIQGLEGDNIGAFGMMGGIVDCYDAITSDRVYHKGMTSYDALSKMYHWRSTAFHPGLVEQFIQCMGVYPIGSLVELSDGAVGVVVTVNRQRRLKPRVALVLNSDKRPFEAVKVIDLMEEAISNPAGAPDIRAVLPSGEFGINPTDYLPLAS